MNWMFPYDVSTTTLVPDMAGTGSIAPVEPDDRPSSPGGDQQETDSVSSPSAASFSSSSSSTCDHLTFVTSTQRSPSASPLCFGARKLLWRSNAGGARAHVPNKKEQEEEPKGDVMRRYLRKISRRLRRKASAVDKQSPPPCRGAIVVDDDTARERAEAVASAIAYCKESLRRSNASRVRLVSAPSLDCWLQGWREDDDVIASAATHCNDVCTGSKSQCPPPRQTGWLLERQANAATIRNDSPRPPSPRPGPRDVKESPHR